MPQSVSADMDPVVAGLRGHRYRDVVRRLKRAGFELRRQAAGAHEIWRNQKTGRYTTIPNHPGDLPPATLHAILTRAGVTLEDFLAD